MNSSYRRDVFTDAETMSEDGARCTNMLSLCGGVLFPLFSAIVIATSTALHRHDSLSAFCIGGVVLLLLDASLQLYIISRVNALTNLLTTTALSSLIALAESLMLLSGFIMLLRYNDKDSETFTTAAVLMLMLALRVGAYTHNFVALLRYLRHDDDDDESIHSSLLL